MKILAIDASTSNVGWCIADSDGYVLSGQWRPMVASFAAVLLYREWAISMVGATAPDVVFYERPSGVHGNMWTNALLGALWYETWCCSNNNLVVVSPAEIKKTGVCKGAYQNPYKSFNVSGLSKAAKKRIDDELDAIGCWLAGLEKMKNE